jgi:4-amino-4-deoxy-L-arabinose transferase-like glycosyltransferase
MWKNRWFLLVVIIIIASFFRLYQLKTVPPGLYPDEAMEGNDALQIIHAGSPAGEFKPFYPENNGREGLFVNILVPFIKFLGNEPWVIRLPMAIAGILTVLGVYFLTAELLGATTGLLASFLVATSFWHIIFSRIGFRAMLAPMLLIWALYLFLLAIRRVSSKTWILIAALAGIIYGLGFYTYISYRITPFLFLLFIPFFRKEKNFWKISLVFALFAFITCLPIGYYFLQHPADFTGRTSQISVFNSAHPLKDLGWNILKTAGMFNVRGDYNWRHNISGVPELFWPVGILFVLGVILGIKTLIQNVKIKVQNDNAKFKNDSAERNTKTLHFDFSFLILFLWLILAALPVVISNEGIPHALRAILMIPPVFMLAAIAGIWLYGTVLTKLRNDTKIRKYILRPTFWILLVLLVLEAYQQYFITWAKNKNTIDAFSSDYVEIGREINALPLDVPKYVIVRESGVLGGDVPVSAQTVMFITDSYLPKYRELKNIHYVLPDEEKNIPAGAAKFYLK